MSSEGDLTYRERIYGAYVSARETPLAPTSVEGLRPRLPYLRRLVKKCFPANRDIAILDIGCGHGALLYVLAGEGYTNLRGIDGSEEQVRAAQELGLSSVTLGDAMDALRDEPDASCDVVVAFDVIEHFTKSELLLLIDSVYRVLKPGGYCLIHAPNGESPFSGRVRFGDFTHELAFTRMSISQVLRASGFSEVKSYEDEPTPHGVRSLIRWVLWKGIRGFLRFYLAVETGDTGRGAIFSQNLVTVARKER